MERLGEVGVTSNFWISGRCGKDGRCITSLQWVGVWWDWDWDAQARALYL
jgi:hypothetical protein